MNIFPKEPYCYLCHLKCCGIYCSNCWRCYCKKCSSSEIVDQNSSKKFIRKCSQCVMLQNSRKVWENGLTFQPMKREDIKTVFMNIFGWCSANGKIPSLLIKDDSYFIGRLNPEHKPFTFNNIRKKLRNSTYRCSEELAIDLKTIRHILLASPKKNFIQDEVREVLKYLQNSIRELRLTDECAYCSLYYEEVCPRFLEPCNGKCFLSPCPWAHALVIAKVTGHPSWPAKILNYDEQKKIVRVIFFGTYDTGSIDLQSIFHARDPHHYPEDYDKIRKTIPVKKELRSKFINSVNELKAHIKHLEKKFPNQIKLTTEFKKPWLPTDSIYIVEPEVDRKDNGQINLEEAMDQKEEETLKEKLFTNRPRDTTSPPVNNESILPNDSHHTDTSDTGEVRKKISSMDERISSESRRSQSEVSNSTNEPSDNLANCEFLTIKELNHPNLFNQSKNDENETFSIGNKISRTMIERVNDDGKIITKLEKNLAKKRARLNDGRLLVTLKCVRREFDIGMNRSVDNISQRIAQKSLGNYQSTKRSKGVEENFESFNGFDNQESRKLINSINASPYLESHPGLSVDDLTKPGLIDGNDDSQITENSVGKLSESKDATIISGCIPNLSRAPAIESGIGCALVEFSNDDDDDSISVMFGDIDHRMIDASDDEMNRKPRKNSGTPTG